MISFVTYNASIMNILFNTFATELSHVESNLSVEDIKKIDNEFIVPNVIKM